MEYISKIINYTISFCVGIFIITYLFRVPYYLTGKNKIVNEYYIDNFAKNIPMDYIFVLIYLGIACLFIKHFKIKDTLQKIIVVGLTTMLITGGFMLYFTSKKMTNSFFSRWFHTVGWMSLIYDSLLLCFIYYIYNYMENKTLR